MSEQDLSVTGKSRRGRPPKRNEDRAPETVVVRLAKATVDQVDGWVAEQPGRKPTRAEAVAQLVSKALTDDE